MSAHHSIYVVEDDPGVLRSVLAILCNGRSGFSVLGAATGGKGLELNFEKHPLAILLADWQLPDTDGLDLIVRVKELYPATRCVLMTGFPSPELSLRAILAGADGLLYKPFGPKELLDTLRATVAGQRVLCPMAAAHLADYLRTRPPSPASVSALAPQEIALLQLLCENKLLKEAADLMGISLETARTYRKRIYAKYGVHKLGEARDKFLGGGGETGPARPALPA